MTIPEADRALQSLVETELQDLEPRVVLDAPTTGWADALAEDQLTVSVYLLRAAENAAMRRSGVDMTPDDDGRMGESRPPVMVDLTYIVSVWAGPRAGAETIEHGVLSRLLLMCSTINSIPTNHIPEEAWLPSQSEVLLRSTGPHELHSAEIGQFWRSMGPALRPVIPLTMTIPLETRVERSYAVVASRSLRFDGWDERVVGIAGIVATSGADPRPIGGARVRLLDARKLLLATATADEDGRFSLSSRSDTDLTLEATADGYYDKRTKIRSVDSRNRGDLTVHMRKLGG